MSAQHKSPESEGSTHRNIIFFHPDLGIGGAERLIVDAAVGLQELGHKVTIFTSHCDPEHCFEEARDGTLDVRVRGNTIFPPTILNRFHILLATLRQLHLVLAVGFFSDELYVLRPDTFIVDQLSACVPILRWLYPNKQRTLFYCHFPDQLLVKRNEGGIFGIVKTAYRFPFDWFEGWTMNASDHIVVNSKFTKRVARGVFPSLERDFGVIYPCVSNTQSIDQKEPPLWDGEFRVLLSINRFERKKNIELAVAAYKALPEDERKGTRLIIAGGYDQRVVENVEYHRELVQFAEKSNLKTATAKTVPTALAVSKDVQVLFVLSFSDAFKTTLLQNAQLLIYTPMNEHFGIVPVEAMSFGVPVLASSTGGPLETIVDGETGWLRDSAKPEEWTIILQLVLSQKFSKSLPKFSKAAQDRVSKLFTKSTMARTFDDCVQRMSQAQRSDFLERDAIVLGLGVVGVFIAALLSVVMRAMFQPENHRKFTQFAKVDRKAKRSGDFKGGIFGR